MHQRKGKIPIVGQQQQPAGIVVQPAYRKKPRRAAGQQIHDRLAALRVVKRSHHPARLVHQPIRVQHDRGHGFTVYRHAVFFFIYLKSHLNDLLAVDRDPSRCNDLLAFSAGSHPALR